MFDLHGNEKLAEWKRFRDHLETCDSPLQEVVDFWSLAPFVSNYLNPYLNKDWPDPWQLILDGKFDSLALCLGIMYTLKLTQRFMPAEYEIYMSINPEIKEPTFYLCIDRSFILNYAYKQVVDYDKKILYNTTLLFSTKK